MVVTTVSRFEEPLNRAAASVYVITADDIRRSGAATIAEALRLAPMLNVDRADANQYAISARGFTNVLANKMLVLIDGRTVYTPLFSGVFWEAQDVVLQDVERIEVISGPSTALWGSNAVNGLIHVITRDAAQTQGPSVRASAGDRERNASLRQGFALGDSGHMRVYVKSYDRSDTYRADGSSVADQADGTQVGFRADWAQPGQKLTLQGDAYHGTIDPVQTARTFSGANLTANWSALLASGGEASVRAYLERTQRQQPQSFDERLDTLDVVGQYALPPLAGHRLLVGAGYRSAHDQVSTFNAFAFDPGTRNLAWSRVFAQDQVQFGPAVTATLATSVENNPYTGTEVLPSLRLGWQIDGQRFAWASAARAARAPARVDREFFQPAKPPYFLAGGPDFQSERSNAFELGYRSQPSAALSYAVTLYHHQYSRLRSLAPTPAGAQFRNDIEGWARGVESWARWRVLPAWRLDAGLALLQEKLRLREGAVDFGGRQSLGNDPRHWWTLRSALDITPRLAWDISLRHTGALPSPAVPAYTALDTRLAFAATPTLELALAVHNLADPRHPEWGSPANRVEFERAVLLQLRWRP